MDSGGINAGRQKCSRSVCKFRAVWGFRACTALAGFSFIAAHSGFQAIPLWNDADCTAPCPTLASSTGHV